LPASRRVASGWVVSSFRRAMLSQKGGATRMEMPDKQRKAIAKKAARSWSKKAKQPSRLFDVADLMALLIDSEKRAA